jgi:ActR/RegA family two-component response regulator
MMQRLRLGRRSIGLRPHVKPGTRVLIVEDDRSIARVVQLQLEHRGFSVRCCHDGPSGLQEVPKFRPEVEGKAHP